MKSGLPSIATHSLGTAASKRRLKTRAAPIRVRLVAGLRSWAPDWAKLQRLGRADLTAHGFRSTFSDWCAEVTPFPSEVREMALAHAVGNKVEEAYRRGDLFDKRRQLAAAWARYVNGAEVLSFPARQSA